MLPSCCLAYGWVPPAVPQLLSDESGSGTKDASDSRCCDEDVATANIEERSTEISSLLEFLMTDRDTHWLACWTCIVVPKYSARDSDGRSRYWSIMALSLLMHLSFLASTWYAILISWYLASLASSKILWLQFITVCLGSLFQNFLLYPAIMMIRRALLVKRTVPLDPQIYREASTYAHAKTIPLFIFTMVSYGIFIGFDIAIYNLHAMTPLLFTFIPTVAMLCGVFHFIILEQRLSYYSITHLRTKIVTQTLTSAEYLTYRRDMRKRDSLMPTGLVVFTAAVITILCFILLQVLTLVQLTKIEILSSTFYLITCYGKQIVVLIVLLNEVLKVNDQAAKLLYQLADTEWALNEASRLSIYVAMKERPIGSVLFCQRPSKLSLVVQMVSTMLGMSLAFLRALMFSL